MRLASLLLVLSSGLVKHTDDRFVGRLDGECTYGMVDINEWPCISGQGPQLLPCACAVVVSFFQISLCVHGDVKLIIFILGNRVREYMIA